ncbi:2'-5' RNA ligase family protein [Vibrio salinus]|uniref:2'-5' RNA ligase family protein n=1 Tax=Vibrio salinus TaxID=2899784 RepID=UPI001E3DBE28|nr:hypothetical protein [Vibrio salinus]MCE0492740.1 hypothetical protein [Vibrio salinus]
MREEKRIYDAMWHDFGQVIKNEHYQTDPLIEDPRDSRRGITALSYLQNSKALIHEVSDFLQKLQILEPGQYYPPLSDWHLTVLTIITCCENFHLSETEGQDYAEVFKNAVRDIGSFDIQFKGITASPSCILLQGFMPDESLSYLREKLRAAFNQSHLYMSRDSRYQIATAHSTMVRFKESLQNPNRLFEFLKDYREFDFGVHTVDCVKLVSIDWYVKKEHTKLLANVPLTL